MPSDSYSFNTDGCIDITLKPASLVEPWLLCDECNPQLAIVGDCSHGTIRMATKRSPACRSSA